jgi:hypothetical protein
LTMDQIIHTLILVRTETGLLHSIHSINQMNPKEQCIHQWTKTKR